MKLSKRLKKYAIAAVVLYPFSIGGIRQVIMDLWPRLKAEEAQRVLAEEKAKLGIKSNVALQIGHYSMFWNKSYGGFCGSNDQGFVIVTYESNLNRILLRHELEHVADGECLPRLGATIDDTITMVKVAKPRAIGDGIKFKYTKELKADIYALTGLRF